MIDALDPLQRALERTLTSQHAFERILESLPERQLERAMGPCLTAARRLDTLNLVQPLHSPRIELPSRAPERGRPHTAGDPEVEASQAAYMRRLRDRWYGG